MPFENALPAIVSTLLVLALASPASSGGEVVITQAKAYAGNVTPGDPPGFPVVITQPGAYVLESNLTVPAGNYGFAINASNVDLDMNGFTLSGNGTATYGIYSSFGLGRIHDGNVNSFSRAAIYLPGQFWSIDKMKIASNAHAIIISKALILSDSFIFDSSLGGVSSGGSSAFYRNTFLSNSGYAISCGSSCHIEGNLIDANGVGILANASGSMALGNTITRNTGYGYVDSSGGMSNNTFVDNNPAGTKQVSGARDLQPNICVGKPCSAP